MLSQWLMRLYRSHNHLQFEARIAQRQSLVKQLHERQLDLLITTEAPKMDEFSSQIVGQFSPALYASEPAMMKADLNYLRPEWGLIFSSTRRG